MALTLACASPRSPAPAASADTAPSVARAKATSSWHPLLFRIEGTKPSYLFGTVHVPDARIGVFPAELDGAIAGASEIVGEIPLGDAPDLQHMFVLPEGKSLSTELPPRLHGRLKKAFEDAGLGAAFALFEHRKVWVMAIQVSLLRHPGAARPSASGTPIDIVIQQKAKAQGKPTSGLESEADQLAVFDGLTREEQARLLEQRLDQRDDDARSGSNRAAKLMDAYVAGLEAPLLAELNAAFDPRLPVDQKLFARLITDRNAKLTEGIAARVAGHPATSYFFAIGAAHLLGDEGIVARLRKRGIRVERVLVDAD